MKRLRREEKIDTREDGVDVPVRRREGQWRQERRDSLGLEWATATATATAEEPPPGSVRRWAWATEWASGLQGRKEERRGGNAKHTFNAHDQDVFAAELCVSLEVVLEVVERVRLIQHRLHQRVAQSMQLRIEPLLGV